MAKDFEKELNPSSDALYNMFLEEYINFGYAYGGALLENSICKTFTRDAIDDLLAQNLIQKQEKDEIIRYELTLSEKKKLLEERNLFKKWSIALGTSLLCDRELTAVYGKSADINQLNTAIDTAELTDEQINEIEILAEDIIKLAREIDPYEYMDAYETEEKLFDDTVQLIANGDVQHLIDWYQPIVDEEFKEAPEAQRIIDRLQKFVKGSNTKESFTALIKNTDNRKNMKPASLKEITLPER